MLYFGFQKLEISGNIKTKLQGTSYKFQVTNSSPTLPVTCNLQPVTCNLQPVTCNL